MDFGLETGSIIYGTNQANEAGPSKIINEDFNTELDNFRESKDRAKLWFYLSNFLFFSDI